MKKTAILIYLASAASALAHPGHDPALPAESLAHYIFTPTHGLGLVALAGVVALVLHRLAGRSGHE